MEGGVDLSIAAAVEALHLRVPRPDRDRRGAVPAGEGGTRAESVRAGHLTHDLRRREHPTAVQSEKRRRQTADDDGDLVLEEVGLTGQLPRARDELPGDASDCPVHIGHPWESS